MIRLTIYRVGDTLELLLPKRFTGKDFPSNTVKYVELAHYSDGKIEDKIYIRPYYRKQINGVLNIFAEEELASASNTPAFTNEVEFIPSQVSLKLASTAAGLDGASAINVTSFNMEIAKNAEALYVLGSNEPQDIINKQFSVTGTIELYFEDTTQRA